LTSVNNNTFDNSRLTLATTFRLYNCTKIYQNGLFDGATKLEVFSPVEHNQSATVFVTLFIDTETM